MQVNREVRPSGEPQNRWSQAKRVEFTRVWLHLLLSRFNLPGYSSHITWWRTVFGCPGGSGFTFLCLSEIKSTVNTPKQAWRELRCSADKINVISFYVQSIVANVSRPSKRVSLPVHPAHLDYPNQSCAQMRTGDRKRRHGDGDSCLGWSVRRVFLPSQCHPPPTINWWLRSNWTKTGDTVKHFFSSVKEASGVQERGVEEQAGYAVLKLDSHL